MCVSVHQFLASQWLWPFFSHHFLKGGRSFPAPHRCSQSVCLGRGMQPWKPTPALKELPEVFKSSLAVRRLFAQPCCLCLPLPLGCGKAIMEFWLQSQFRRPLVLPNQCFVQPYAFSAGPSLLWEGRKPCPGLLLGKSSLCVRSGSLSLGSPLLITNLVWPLCYKSTFDDFERLLFQGFPLIIIYQMLLSVFNLFLS